MKTRLNQILLLMFACVVGLTLAVGCDEFPSKSDGSNEVENGDCDDCDKEAPVTEAPATEAPATEAPATEAPATEAPATEAPATEAPATEAPATILSEEILLVPETQF